MFFSFKLITLDGKGFSITGIRTQCGNYVNCLWSGFLDLSGIRSFSATLELVKLVLLVHAGNSSEGNGECWEHSPLGEASLYYGWSPVLQVWIQQLHYIRITTHFLFWWTPVLAILPPMLIILVLPNLCFLLHKTFGLSAVRHPFNLVLIFSQGCSRSRNLQTASNESTTS